MKKEKSYIVIIPAYNEAESLTGLLTEIKQVLPDVPVMGIVTRLVAHKGLDLIKRIMWELLESTDMQLVILGSGDWEYEAFFKELAAAFPEKVGLRLGFIPDLARKIYAGSDMFLMPSKSEPCGLSQMVALRYGSILAICLI